MDKERRFYLLRQTISRKNDSSPQARKRSRTERVSGSPVYESTPHRKPAGGPELDGCILTRARPATSSWDPVEATFPDKPGGWTGGTAMRRMLRRVATNDVLKLYILRGRKGKKAFQDLTICRVITAVSQKNFPALTAAGLDWKFDPHRRSAEKD
ncbi:hypothetical protein PFLUV_G00268570 [Perca fluviatilis]|uniref:Uncharacterized protein n=1 Tax=Perca fluviatilis TaxID=8168 RepID=A0A6A5E9P6_PERFL|nr:hypothetical protein PFLUV_G00268570 [Perca fluviatilis]